MSLIRRTLSVLTLALGLVIGGLVPGAGVATAEQHEQDMPPVEAMPTDEEPAGKAKPAEPAAPEDEVESDEDAAEPEEEPES